MSRVFPRSYRAKLLSVVLSCTLLPMLCLVVWLLHNNGSEPQRLLIGSIVGVGATAVGSLLSLLLIYRLLEPLRRAADVLDQYQKEQRLPMFPGDVEGRDEVARLLRGIQHCLHGMNQDLRELERHAHEDPLTHAMNRRGAETALQSSVDKVGRSHADFVLLVVDVDNLKTINDSHGHAMGDNALVWLVDSARQCCVGEADWIARWGGDEFVLGLHADATVALDRIEVWMKVLESAEGGAPPVYVSIGAASWQPGLPAADLYSRADQAMYQAKFAGGRRIVLHDHETLEVRSDVAGMRSRA